MSQLPNKELDFSSVSVAKPKYRFRKMVPDQSQPALSLTSNTSSSFTLPPNIVYNLAKSHLNFTITLAAQAGDFVNARVGCMSAIQGLRLSTERGIILVDINNVPSYTQAVWPVCTEQKALEFQGDEHGPMSFLPRSNTTAALSPVILNSGASAADTRSYNNTMSFISSRADGTAVNLVCSVPLGLIYHTFLAEKADLYLGESLVLDITWAPLNSYAFDSDDLALANAGALVAGSMAASSLFMYLAQQDNYDIIHAVKSQVLGSGLNLVSQFVSEFKESTGNGTTYSKAVKINASRGSELLRAYHIVELNTATSSLSHNINNRSGTPKWTAVRTYVDNIPDSDYHQTVVENYNQNKDIYEGSCIASAEEFYDYPVIVQDFSGLSGPALKDTRARGGKNLIGHQVELNFDLGAKTAADYSHYCFCVTNKMVRLSQEGVQVHA